MTTLAWILAGWLCAAVLAALLWTAVRRVLDRSRPATYGRFPHIPTEPEPVDDISDGACIWWHSKYDPHWGCRIASLPKPHPIAAAAWELHTDRWDGLSINVTDRAATNWSQVNQKGSQL